MRELTAVPNVVAPRELANTELIGDPPLLKATLSRLAQVFPFGPNPGTLMFFSAAPPREEEGLLEFDT